MHQRLHLSRRRGLIFLVFPCAPIRNASSGLLECLASCHVQTSRSSAQLLYAKKLAQGKGLVIPDDARINSVAMSAWIDTNRVKKRRKLNRKTSKRPVRSVASQAAPPKMSRKQKVDTDPALLASVPANSIRTPLRIPYGNKEVALKLGARYGSEGWYAPPGVDLSAFGDRGWLL